MTLAGRLRPAKFREKNADQSEERLDRVLSNIRSLFGEGLSRSASRLPIAKPGCCSTQAVMRQDVPAGLGGTTTPSVAAPVRDEVHSCFRAIGVR